MQYFDANMKDYDFPKESTNLYLHIAFRVLRQFEAIHGTSPLPWNISHMLSFIDLAQPYFTLYHLEEQSYGALNEYLKKFALTSSGDFHPLVNILFYDLSLTFKQKGGIYGWLCLLRDDQGNHGQIHSNKPILLYRMF